MFSEQQQPASVLGQKRDADEIAQFGSQEQQYANNNMMDMQAAAAAQHPGFKRRMVGQLGLSCLPAVFGTEPCSCRRTRCRKETAST